MSDDWYCHFYGKRNPLIGSIRYWLFTIFSNRKPEANETEKYVYKYSSSWTNVKDQFEYFKNSGLTEKPLYITLNNYMDYANTCIGVADLLYFCDNGGYSPNHAGIVSSVKDGMIYYSGHTNARLDRPLKDYFALCPNATIIVLSWKED